MSEGYRVPAREHNTETTVSNSRFITVISPAPTIEAAKAYIQHIRKSYPDANHHVYAYRIGYGNSVTEGMSDDGEPSGTAGPPTLSVVRGSDIGDIVLITTRYFGGTKLGTGGLVRAYTDAAKAALQGLPTTILLPKAAVSFILSYSDYESATRLIRQYDGVTEEEIFTDIVTLRVTLLASVVEQFSRQLTDLTAGRVKVRRHSV